jgi:hypothetical protein
MTYPVEPKTRESSNWDNFFRALDGAEIPEGFLSQAGRDDEDRDDRDPFAGWTE